MSDPSDPAEDQRRRPAPAAADPSDPATCVQFAPGAFVCCSQAIYRSSRITVTWATHARIQVGAQVPGVAVVTLEREAL